MSSLLRGAAEWQAPETSPRVHELDDSHCAELVELADTDPIVNSVVTSRLGTLGTLEPRRFGGAVHGARSADGRLAGAVFCGGNLLPIGGGPAEWDALARRVVERDRACSSIVGRAAAVAGMWRVLGPVWGPARAIRAEQPLLVLGGNVELPGDRRVRAIRPDELAHYLPAAAAMFSEELGVSPHECPGLGDYRQRVAGLISEGRAFGIIERNGRVLFKADIGAVSLHTCQLQGVWVRPDQRGRGIGTAALATVLSHALTLAPTVSLYVNDFNTPARRMYETLGMRQIASLSTVLF